MNPLAAVFPLFLAVAVLAGVAAQLGKNRIGAGYGLLTFVGLTAVWLLAMAGGTQRTVLEALRNPDAARLHAYVAHLMTGADGVRPSILDTAMVVDAITAVMVGAPTALLLIALLPRRPSPAASPAAAAPSRTCPFCAETIKAEARVCRYCGRDLPALATAPAEAPAAADWRTKEPCPHCGTGVSLAATRCPNCHSDLDADPAWRRRRAS